MDQDTMFALEDYIENNEHTNVLITNELKEGHLTMGMIEALECLCETLQGKEALTEADHARFEAADLFATAGTGTEVGNIVPALEADATPAIAMESLVAKIQNGIQSLASSSEIVMGLVEKRLAGMGTLVKAYEAREKELTDALAGMNGSTSKSLKLRVTLGHDDRPIRNIREYIDRVKESADMFEDVIGTFNRRGKSLQRTMVQTFKSFADTSYTETMCKTFNLLNGDILGEMSRNFNEVATKGATRRLYSPNLLGDKGFYIRVAKDPMIEDDLRAIKRDKIDMMSWRLIRPSEYHSGRTSIALEFDNVTVHDMQALLAQTTRNLGLIRHYYQIGGQDFRDYRNMIGNLIKVAASLAGSVVGTQIADAIIKRKYFQAILYKMAPPGVAEHLGTIFLGSFTGGVVAGQLAEAVLWVQRKIAGFVFSTMKLQYRVDDFMSWMDTQVVNFAIEDLSRQYVIVRRFAK